MADESILKIGFRIFVPQIQEFEHEWIADFFIRGDVILLLCFYAFCEHGSFVFRKEGTLVELGADLAIKLLDGPATAQGLRVVEGESLVRFQTDEPRVMRPGMRQTGGESFNLGEDGGFRFPQRHCGNPACWQRCSRFRNP